MSKNKPVIVITGPDEGGGAAWFFTALSVWLAGGTPMRMTPKIFSDNVNFEGLILGGGADVEPKKYGQERKERAVLAKDKRTIFEWILSILFFPIYWVTRYFRHTKMASVDLERDKTELRLLEVALEQNKPVLGICRGMQLINVYFKGTLHQDISGYYTEQLQVASIFPKKRILLEKESKLKNILATNICNVNALHNQAVDEPGNNIVFTAKEKYTEIVQGFEHTEYPFVIGVQWHPEYLIQISRQRNIFKELVTCAKDVKN